MVMTERVSSATARLNNQNTVLVMELTKERENRAELQEELERVTAEAAELRSSLTTLKQQLIDAIHTAHAREERLSDEIKRLSASGGVANNADVARLKTELAALQAQHAADAAAFSSAEAGIRDLEIQLADAKEEVLSYERRTFKAIAEAAAFRTVSREMEVKLKVAEAKLQMVDEADEKNKAKIEGLRVELSLARQGALRAERYQANMEESKALVEQMRQREAELRAEAAKAKEEAATAREELAEAVKATCTANARARTSMAAVRSFRKESIAAGLQDPFHALGQSMKRRLTACGVEAAAEASSVRESVEECLEEEEEGLADVDKAIEILDMEEEHKGDDRDLEAELAEAREAKETAEAAVAAARAHAEAYEAKAKELEMLLERQRAEAEASHSDAETARVELAKVQSSRRQLVQELLDAKGNLRVIARVRPAGTSGGLETDGALKIVGDEQVVMLSQEGEGEAGRAAVADKSFMFNRVFGPSSTQQQVFDEVRPMVEGVLDGTSATIFAYGQTGAGKTHTMMGGEADPGVIPRSISTLLSSLAARRAEKKLDSTLQMGMLEIYCENIRDLLTSMDAEEEDPKALSIHQDAKGQVFVDGMVFQTVETAEEAGEVMQAGLARRMVASTSMNAESSRSHLVTMVRFTEKDASTELEVHSSLFLIDLAGSERIKKSEAEGQRLTEAQAINKSLSSLGDVLSALQVKSKHVPFRNTKLTHLLKSALEPGGGCRGTMIIQVSPALENAQETTCTLAFGQRATSVELGKASKKLESSVKASRAKGEITRLEERILRTEIALEKERSAHSRTKDELSALQQRERSLRGLVSRGGRKPATSAAARRARTVATSAAELEASRDSVESAMEAACEWLSPDAIGSSTVPGFAPQQLPEDSENDTESQAPLTPRRQALRSGASRSNMVETPTSTSKARSRVARRGGDLPPKTPIRAPRTPSTDSHAASLKRRLASVASRVDTNRSSARPPSAKAARPPATPMRV
jgi:hypothetical protein